MPDASGYAIRFDPRPVIVGTAIPVVTVTLAVAVNYMITGEFHGGISGTGGLACLALFLRRTRLVIRREKALQIDSSGIYLGTTLHKPEPAPELIPWERISSVEIAEEREDDERDVSITVWTNRADETADVPPWARHGPLPHSRKVDGWRLNADAIEQAIRQHGPSVGFEQKERDRTTA